jgi:hypothetical protein
MNGLTIWKTSQRQGQRTTLSKVILRSYSNFVDLKKYNQDMILEVRTEVGGVI